MKKSAIKIIEQLPAVAETFRAKIYDQHNLLALALKQVIPSSDFATVEALLKAINQANDDLFNIYQSLENLLEGFEAAAPTAKEPAEPRPENMGIFRHDVIRMDEKRSMRFHKVLLSLCDANMSLATATSHFPPSECEHGQMEPRGTVLAFTSRIESKSNLLLSMVSCEEHLNPEMQESANA